MRIEWPSDMVFGPTIPLNIYEVPEELFSNFLSVLHDVAAKHDAKILYPNTLAKNGPRDMEKHGLVTAYIQMSDDEAFLMRNIKSTVKEITDEIEKEFMAAVPEPTESRKMPMKTEAKTGIIATNPEGESVKVRINYGGAVVGIEAGDRAIFVSVADSDTLADAIKKVASYHMSKQTETGYTGIIATNPAGKLVTVRLGTYDVSEVEIKAGDQAIFMSVADSNTLVDAIKKAASIAKKAVDKRQESDVSIPSLLRSLTE